MIMAHCGKEHDKHADRRRYCERKQGDEVSEAIDNSVLILCCEESVL